jgi:hypothetical protein
VLLARRPLAYKTLILGWSTVDELDPVHNDARSRQSLALDVKGPVRSMVYHCRRHLVVGSWAEPDGGPIGGKRAPSQGVYARSVNPVFAGFVAFGSLMLFLVFVNLFKPRSKRYERGRHAPTQLETEDRSAEASLRSGDGEAEG